MKISFQADNDIDQTLILAILQVEPEVDFNTANDLGLHGLPDSAVLELAALEKCILVSSDVRTMPRHFSEFIQKHKSYGVLIVPQSIKRDIAVEEILNIWYSHTPDEWIDRISFIPIPSRKKVE